MTTHRTAAAMSRRTALAGLGAGGLGLALTAAFRPAAQGAAPVFSAATAPAGGRATASGSDHFALANDDAEAIWFLGTLALIKGGGGQTGDALATVEFLHPPGFGTVLHVHHTADEAFYVLAGAMQGVCGEQEWRGPTGSFVWLPRGIPHGYAVDGEETLRTLAIALPAGFDRFVVEGGEPARERTLPPPAAPDVEKLNAAAAKVGIEHLGPPEQ